MPQTYCSNCYIVPINKAEKYCDSCTEELVDWLYHQECLLQEQVEDQQYLEEIASKQEDFNYYYER